MNPTNTPGLYTATLFPHRARSVTVRLFGTLPNAEVDVPVDPEEVLPARAICTQPLPDTIALQEQVNQLQAKLQSARTLSYLGGGVGLLGVVLGLVGLLRRRPG